MKAEARVEFSLPARAENVSLVRHALAGLAEALEMESVGGRRPEDGGHRGLHERRRPRLSQRGRHGPLEVDA